MLAASVAWAVVFQTKAVGSVFKEASDGVAHRKQSILAVATTDTLARASSRRLQAMPYGTKSHLPTSDRQNTNANSNNWWEVSSGFNIPNPRAFRTLFAILYLLGVTDKNRICNSPSIYCKCWYLDWKCMIYIQPFCVAIKEEMRVWVYTAISTLQHPQRYLSSGDWSSTLWCQPRDYGGLSFWTTKCMLIMLFQTLRNASRAT